MSMDKTTSRVISRHIVFCIATLVGCSQSDQPQNQESVASEIRSAYQQAKEQLQRTEEQLKRAQAFAVQLENLRVELQKKTGKTISDVSQFLSACAALPEPTAAQERFNEWAEECKTELTHHQSDHNQKETP